MGSGGIIHCESFLRNENRNTTNEKGELMKNLNEHHMLFIILMTIILILGITIIHWNLNRFKIRDLCANGSKNACEMIDK